MPYFHGLYAPFHVGDRIKFVKSGYTGLTGTVTSRNPENAFHAEDCEYGVTIDGEEKERTGFDYWAMELLPNNPHSPENPNYDCFDDDL